MDSINNNLTEIRINEKPQSDLGDKNNIALCFADAAMGVMTNKTKPSHAGWAHIPMTTRSISHPFQSICTHRTTIVHRSQLNPNFTSRTQQGNNRDKYLKQRNPSFMLCGFSDMLVNWKETDMRRGYSFFRPRNRKDLPLFRLLLQNNSTFLPNNLDMTDPR